MTIDGGALPENQDGIRDALGRFQAGTSGNPGGRPSGAVSLTVLIKRQLREHPEEADAIVARLFGLARDPDPKVALAAIREVLDRVDGKALVSAEISSAPSTVSAVAIACLEADRMLAELEAADLEVTT